MKPTVIVFGFGKSEAVELKNELREVVDSSFRITSAYGRTNCTLRDIASDPPTHYSPMRRKIMVFVRFSPNNQYHIHKYYTDQGRRDLYWLIATSEEQLELSYHQATFRYMGGGGGGSIVRALIAILLMMAITVILAAVLYVNAQSFKPAIYLYTPEKRSENLRLTVKGEITTRIPYRKGRSTITWNDLILEEGKIHTDGRQFDYLFYESDNTKPKVENKGWVLKREDGQLYWNGDAISEADLASKFEEILEMYGLFENEIADFVEYWFDDDMKIFFGGDEFNYGIYPVSPGELDRIFRIDTELDYPEYIRVQFYMKEIPETVVLQEPVPPRILRSGYALHEWGVIKG